MNISEIIRLMGIEYSSHEEVLSSFKTIGVDSITIGAREPRVFRACEIRWNDNVVRDQWDSIMLIRYTRKNGNGNGNGELVNGGLFDILFTGRGNMLDAMRDLVRVEYGKVYDVCYIRESDGYKITDVRVTETMSVRRGERYE